MTAFLRGRSERSKDKDWDLTVGFDGYPFVEPLTGIGHYAYHILKNIDRRGGVRINLYTHTLVPEKRAPGLFIPLDHLKNVRYRCYPIPEKILFGTRFWFGVGAAVVTPLFVAFDRNDVFFAPNYVAPKLFWVMGKKVITVHDCTFAFYPELLRTETLKHLVKHLPREVKGAAKIIADSAQTKMDIQRIYALPPEKIQVISPGNPIRNSRATLNLKMPYVLFVGTLEPRKNIAALLDAYEIIRRGGIHLHLYLVGKIGWGSRLILEKIRSHPFCEDIFQVSYVPSEHLPVYYKKAFCLAYPSLYEGFGFPVLEAMSLGCPVITTRLSSLPEVGGDACYYVEPDPASIAAGIVVLHGNEQFRKDLMERGRRQAQKFSWEACARKTLEVLAQAAAR